MTPKHSWMLVGLSWAAWPGVTQAKPIDPGEEDAPYTVAVQNRVHTQRDEFTVWLGSLPMDAFTKGITFSGGYTLHFNDLVAWEVLNFTYSVGVDTRLLDELNNLPQPVGPTPFELVEYYGTSNVMIKPAYGKLAWFNRSVIHQELYFVAGAGAGRMTLTSRPVVDIGVGERIYAGEHLSFRLDIRDIVLMTSGDRDNELWVALGMSLAFGGGRR